jgi:hypothetical protein
MSLRRVRRSARLPANLAMRAPLFARKKLIYNDFMLVLMALSAANNLLSPQTSRFADERGAYWHLPLVHSNALRTAPYRARGDTAIILNHKNAA